MRTRHTTLTGALLTAALGIALTGCATETAQSSSDSATATPSAERSATIDTGMPPRPTGVERQELLDAIAEAAPDAVRYEDKAIDAARNQCFSINGGGKRLDWSASQRFTYKDVTTTEAQGKEINAALKRIGFCDA